MAVDATTRGLVRRRAGDRCEYCLYPQAYSPVRHHVEHIVARQHRGGDDESNLALACQHCNSRKGPNLTGIDPDTGVLARLFHPRQDAWEEHLEVRVPLILGKTSIGRATVEVLSMNSEHRMNVRRELIDQGLFP